jgi:IQ domain-containing protein H
VNIWGDISVIIGEIEKMLQMYLPVVAWISSRKLKLKALEQLDSYSRDDLFQLVTNIKQVKDVICNPKKMYKGPKGFELAATMIQKQYRYYRAYSNFRQLKFLMSRATYIQRKYRLFQIKNKTKIKLRQLMEDRYENWNDMQDQFKIMWPTIKSRKRIEIHINSFSLDEMQRISIEKFKQKENSQLNRLFNMKDPKVEIIYVCPFPLSADVFKFYMNILELVEIE